MDAVLQQLFPEFSQREKIRAIANLFKGRLGVFPTSLRPVRLSLMMGN
jgi:hypothetical protein